MGEAQEKMKRLEESSNKEILERAWAEITALCSEGKQWRMTIPVDADRDSDILFGDVLKRFAQLEAELEKYRTKFADNTCAECLLYGIECDCEVNDGLAT